MARTIPRVLLRVRSRENVLCAVTLLCFVSYFGIPLLFRTTHPPPSSSVERTKLVLRPRPTANNGHRRESAAAALPLRADAANTAPAIVQSLAARSEISAAETRNRPVRLPIPGQVWPPLDAGGEIRAKYEYVILLWKHGPRMVRRFLRSYGVTLRDPYASCSVDNCAVSIDDTNALNVSDAVLIHLHRTAGPSTLPRHRHPHQRWIFFTDESPYHTFFVTNRYTMKDYDGLFNWSMTYRSDSDIPVPYGRTVVLAAGAERAEPPAARDFAKGKTGLVTILGSNCGGRNHRWEYVAELSKHIRVDVYGGCGKSKCPGHFTRDCPVLANYKFYLAFENSNCREYVTEKLWWNAYSKDVVPVVMGAPREDYERLCPPNSFVHVDDFAAPKDLAEFLLRLSRNDTAYNEYFAWKSKFAVSNEHGYFGSPSLHLCRMCEALNRNSAPRTYTDLRSFWNAKRDCRPPRWTPLPGAR